MSQVNELRERIARIIHAEWVRLMQKTIAETPAEYNDLSSKLYLKKHWESVWKPYDRVSERDRAHAREMADKVLDVFFGWLGSLREDAPTEGKEKEKDSIKVRHIILMLLDAHGGALAGSDSIHAEVYLLHSIFFNLFCKLNLAFRHHYYGYPYSSKIVHAVDELVGAGFVNKRFYCCDTPGLVLLDSGYSLVRELRVEYTEEYDAIKQFVERLGCVDFVYGLRAAAKVHFLVEGEGDVLTRERAIREMRQFSPHISVTSINVAVEILNRLGLLEQ